MALVVELLTGPVVHWVALPIIAIVLAGFSYVMVVAARRHVSVELTSTVLRQGTEELPVAEIEAVLPPPPDDRRDPERWETARSLGELADVPRGRKPVGRAAHRRNVRAGVGEGLRRAASTARRARRRPRSDRDVLRRDDRSLTFEHGRAEQVVGHTQPVHESQRVRTQAAAPLVDPARDGLARSTDSRRCSMNHALSSSMIVSA